MLLDFFFIFSVSKLSRTYFSTHIHTHCFLYTSPSVPFPHSQSRISFSTAFFHNSSYFFHIIWNNEMWKSCCNFLSFSFFLLSFFSHHKRFPTFNFKHTHTHNTFIFFTVTVLQFICLFICLLIIAKYVSLSIHRYFLIRQVHNCYVVSYSFIRQLKDKRSIQSERSLCDCLTAAP